MTTSPQLTLKLRVDQMERTWVQKVLPYAKAHAQRLGQFTSDDIRREVLSPYVIGLFGEPEHPNHVGALCSQVVGALNAQEIGRVRSSRPERNGAKITLYAIR